MDNAAGQHIVWPSQTCKLYNNAILLENHHQSHKYKLNFGQISLICTLQNTLKNMEGRGKGRGFQILADPVPLPLPLVPLAQNPEGFLYPCSSLVPMHERVRALDAYQNLSYENMLERC